jgi:hypothetical protein
MTWLCLTVTEYLCHKWPRTCSTCRKHFPVLCLFMISFSWLFFVTRVTRCVSPVEQELLTLPEYLTLSPVCSGFRVAPFYVFYVVFFYCCLSFGPFPLIPCAVFPSSIYRFWLTLWSLQTLLVVCFVQDQHTWVLIELIHWKKTVQWLICHSTRTHYYDPKPKSV